MINDTTSDKSAEEQDTVPTINNQRSNSIATSIEASIRNTEHEDHISAQSSLDSAPGNIDTIIDLNDTSGSVAIDSSLTTSSDTCDTTELSEKQSSDPMPEIGEVLDYETRRK